MVSVRPSAGAAVGTGRDGPAGTTAGHLLWLVRTGRARTRAELQRVTGASRSTIGHRLDRLIRAGYVRETGSQESTGGRPPAVLELNPARGVVLAAGLGATHGRLAVLDVGGRVLAEEDLDQPIDAGPEAVLDRVARRFAVLLGDAPAAGADPGGRGLAPVCGIGVGVPGPVEFATGRVRQPPIMPGWDGFPIAQRLRRHFDVPVVVDNDANLMALGEQATGHPDCPAFVLVKVATGIGAGVVVDGQIYRGIDGGAGDIGHVRVQGGGGALCMCGSHGCLAALASGGVLARRLSGRGVPVASSREFVARVAAGHPEAAVLAREAGRLVGEVLATVVSLVNPGVLMIAGDLAESHFLAGVRETLYHRALPRATRHLQVVTGRLGDRASVVGAHALVVERLYAPDAVDAALASAGTAGAVH